MLANGKLDLLTDSSLQCIQGFWGLSALFSRKSRRSAISKNGYLLRLKACSRLLAYLNKDDE